MIRVLTAPTDAIIQLLSDTVWGMKGPLFIHTDVEHRILTNKENYYFVYEEGDELCGVVVICQRKCLLANKPVSHFYTRYFSVNPQYRGKKIGEQLLQAIRPYFKQKFNNNQSFVYYAYIDKKNLRSAKVFENVGFNPITEFRTFTFSRVFLSKTTSVETITFDELKRLSFSDNQLTYTDHSITDSNCYLLRKNGKPIAAVRSLKSNWKFKKIPGWQGFIAKYIISKIPYLKRLFNTKTLTFEALDHLYLHNKFK